MTTPSTDLVLSPDEIFAITHRVRQAEQLKELEAMGIPAHHRKHDNSVCVLRMYVTTRPTTASSEAAANDGPTLKSSQK